ncbi:MAG: CtsR family transcriptional regulator [Ruminococcaceae bacterium]|nr:CtsR family transcriptional regulator [Oscillospiraceae bacterium]
MRSSDLIAEFIKDLLSENDSVELGRNELAIKFSVVPSQINYVLSSRFTPEQGYIVESRRGGGGYIKISRPNYTKKGYIMHILNSIGQRIDAVSIKIFLSNMYDNGVIDKKSLSLMASALSDKNFSGVPPQYWDILRASIFKSMLIGLED